MISLAISSFLVVGLSASLMISSRMVTPSDRMRDVLDASGISLQLTDELRYAIHIVESTDKTIEFALADRTGDGTADVVRYEWSGTPGDPLLRAVNHGTPVEVLGNVHDLAFTYDARSIDESIETTLESNEQVLSSWVGTEDVRGNTITNTRWRAQYFKPTLPVGTLSWKVSKAMILARPSGGTVGQSWVQLRPATGTGTPTSTVLEQVLLLETTLSDPPVWSEFSYSNVSGLSPDAGLCLVIQHKTGTSACAPRYQHSAVLQPNLCFLESTNQGSTWNMYPERALLYYIHGTYTTVGPPQLVTRRYLTGVNLSVSGGNDSNSRIDTGTALLNSPELVSGYWKLEFDSNPTDADVNFDGSPDWVSQTGTPFDESDLNGSVWKADPADGIQLNTSPSLDFAKLTTVEVSCRNTAIGGLGAVFRMNLDRSGSTSGVVYSSVALQADGTQTVRVFMKPDAGTDVQVAKATGLDNGMVWLRFVVNPDADTVAVWVDDSWLGTYSYTRYANPGNRFFQVAADGSKAEFDYVSIRVAQ